MKKKITIKPIIASVLTLMASFTMLPITGYAYESNHENDYENVPIVVDMNNAFVESEGEYDYIEKKIEEESANVTGLIDEDVEKILNESGILDEDIEKLSNEEIEEFENNINENSLIYVSYYAVNDIEELSELPVQQDEMIELTPEQVDEYIAEKYYDEETDLREELAKALEDVNEDNKEENVLNTFSNAIGLKVKDVCAETISHGGVSDKANPTMLRKRLIINELKDGLRFQVYFCYEWTDMPIHREMDTMIMSWGGACYDACDKIYSKKTNVVHYWLENIEESGKTVKCEYKTTILKEADDGNAIKAEQYFIQEKYICCAIKMRQDYKIKEIPLKEVIYTDESVTMNFYLKKTRDMEGVIFYPYYYHIQEDYSKQLDTIITVTASIFDRGYATAIYSLSSFNDIEFKQKSCGVAPGRRFMHTYK